MNGVTWLTSGGWDDATRAAREWMREYLAARAVDSLGLDELWQVLKLKRGSRRC